MLNSSFNAFGSKASDLGQSHAPVWLGVVTPRPVGGVLAAAFVKKGIRIPAGTGVNLTSGTITPLLTFKVKAVASGVATLTLPAEYGFTPAVGEYLFKVSPSAFASNGSPVAITAVAVNATDASLLDVTVAIEGLAANDVVAWAPSSTALAAPNGYLYNDIYLGDLDVTAAAVSAGTVGATGAVVDFHGEGLLIALTPCSDIAAAMKAAVPNVIQVV